MKLGLDIADFTWPAGPAKLGSTLADIARTADQAGFDSIWVMDHFWQIRMNGPEHHEMLEGYSALSYIAAVTSRAKLGTMVTGVVYHQRSEEHTSELQSRFDLVCRLLLEKKKKKIKNNNNITTQLQNPYYQ